MRKLFIVSLVGLSCFANSLHAQEKMTSEPAQTTLCEVVADSVRFSGKRIRFRAFLLSDGLEHTVLVDSKCKAGIVPFMSQEAKDRSDIKALNHALGTGKPGSINKQIRANFTGRFKYSPEDSPHRTSRVLEVEMIDSLEVHVVNPLSQPREK